MKRRDQICLGLGGAALLTSVLIVGGALRWAEAIVAVFIALALAIQLFARRRLDRISPLVVLLGVASLLTLFQLIPLPSTVLDALDSAGNHLRADGAAIAGTSPWPSISLDPGGSLRALGYFVILAGVALLSLRFAASERGRFALLGGVAVTCGLAAAVTGFHTLVSAHSLYGLYTPMHTEGSPIMGPLLNPNHMGGLMAIGAVLSLGLAFFERQPTQLRVLWVVIGFGCLVVAGLSLSRGAMLGMGIGLIVVIGMLFARRAADTKRRLGGFRRDLPIAVVIGVGVAVALYMSAGNVADQLQSTSLTELDRPVSKYEAWKSSIKLVRESPWVGVGRGAIESSLTRVHPASAYFTFSHLENEYLSAVVEWGIPGSLLLACVFVWCVMTAARRWRDGPLAGAALGALAMILFQSSVDFGIELLGIAVPVTIIASTVQLVPLRPALAPGRALIARIALISVLLIMAALFLLPATSSVQEDHDRLLAIHQPDLADVRSSIERHPVDYFGFGVAADIASRNNDLHAVNFLNHALALHPSHPGLHRLAARMLVGLKKYPQAAVEYALAMSTEGAPRQLLSEIVLLMPNADDAAAAIPSDYPNVDVMLRSLDHIKRPDIAERWLMRVAHRPQRDVRIIDQLYQLAMSRKDYDVAQSAAELRMSVSRTATSRLLLAKVQFQRKDFDVLLKDLADVARWSGRIDEKAEAWFVLCDVHIERREWDPALECIHKLDASGLLNGSRYEVNKRLEIINEERTREAKLHAIEALERSLGPKPAEPAVKPRAP